MSANLTDPYDNSEQHGIAKMIKLHLGVKLDAEASAAEVSQ
jgi:hypothetical protein